MSDRLSPIPFMLQPMGMCILRATTMVGTKSINSGHASLSMALTIYYQQSRPGKIRLPRRRISTFCIKTI